MGGTARRWPWRGGGNQPARRRGTACLRLRTLTPMRTGRLQDFEGQRWVELKPSALPHSPAASFMLVSMAVEPL